MQKKKIFNKRIIINIFPHLYFFYDKFKINYTNSKEFVLIRIPKTATSKLHQLISQTKSLSNLIDLPHHDIRVYHLMKKDKFIIPLRNPIQRIQSAFYYEVKKEGGADFLILDLIFKKINNFNNFCEWLYSFNPIKYTLSRFYFYTGFHMQDTLYSYFISESHRTPFHIIEQENFEQDFLDLCAKFNIKLDSIDNKNIKKLVNYGNYDGNDLSNLAKKNITKFLSKDFKIYNDLIKQKKRINKT